MDYPVHICQLLIRDFFDLLQYFLLVIYLHGNYPLYLNITSRIIMTTTLFIIPEIIKSDLPKSTRKSKRINSASAGLSYLHAIYDAVSFAVSKAAIFLCSVWILRASLADPIGSIPTPFNLFIISLITSRLFITKVDAKQRQNRQPARSKIR